MLLNLKCIYNLNFFKYKPFSTYLTTLFKVLIYPTLKWRFKSKYKRIREY
jgi:hypothetical protein